MRIARVEVDGRASFAAVEGAPGAEVAHLLDGDPFAGSPPRTGAARALSAVRLLPPVRPTKIVAVGRNYADHISEMGGQQPEAPRIFLKPPSALVAAGEPIAYPRLSDEVHHEAELAVVLGRRCRNLRREDVPAVVLGYTCANDVTARDLQRRDGQPTWAKCFDTFCPLGPWIETDLDPVDLRISCTVNGQTRQDGRTSQMLLDAWSLVAYVSEAMTLEPGDVVLTGTPSGVGPIEIGDVVSVEIEGIGTLANPVGVPPG